MECELPPQPQERHYPKATSDVLVGYHRQTWFLMPQEIYTIFYLKKNNYIII